MLIDLYYKSSVMIILTTCQFKLSFGQFKPLDVRNRFVLAIIQPCPCSIQSTKMPTDVYW